LAARKSYEAHFEVVCKKRNVKADRKNLTKKMGGLNTTTKLFKPKK